MISGTLAAAFICLASVHAFGQTTLPAPDFAGQLRELRRLVEESEARKAFPPPPAPAPAPNDDIVIDIQVENENGGGKTYTLSSSRKQFQRLAKRFRRWEDSESLRRKYGDFQIYSGDLGSKEILAVLDRIFTPINNNTATTHPDWMDGPDAVFVALFTVINKIGESNFYDLLGIEADDRVTEIFGDGPKEESGGEPAVETLAHEIDIPTIRRQQPTGKFRFKTSGHTRVIRKFDPSYLKLKGEYQFPCPASMPNLRIEFGVQIEPFDEEREWKCYLEFKGPL